MQIRVCRLAMQSWFANLCLIGPRAFATLKNIEAGVFQSLNHFMGFEEKNMRTKTSFFVDQLLLYVRNFGLGHIYFISAKT